LQEATKLSVSSNVIGLRNNRIMDSKIKKQNTAGYEPDLKIFFIAKKSKEFTAEELQKYNFIDKPEICVPCSKMFKTKKDINIT
jgi:hypothetical protein